MVNFQLSGYGMNRYLSVLGSGVFRNWACRDHLERVLSSIDPFPLSDLQAAYSNIDLSNLAFHMSPVKGILVSMPAEGFRDCRPGQPNHTDPKNIFTTYPHYQTQSQSEDEKREFSYHPKIRDVVLTLSLV
ncbi:hypothetical protein N7448_006438 [Penicillium atrosanguineum]|uniref:Uncharacterized protein n=1 Tax=Penicillium atrosanguineum TaxID=1132637 RepID=A0A9W9PT06_9EURO|nr:uncharacterized protein N7443_010199 [Penicillium atrosanguineum]KAJ5132280.1 hypothetical protein N7448_006438 [Penicillium atrosanguineum]KAJ5289946.1 hypothetical protein N7443_010199 [Penicillium atrosanguineum]KAJ5307769.1 hypothetical protein N7476_008425 [Penicillium atrosanguineum]